MKNNLTLKFVIFIVSICFFSGCGNPVKKVEGQEISTVTKNDIAKEKVVTKFELKILDLKKPDSTVLPSNLLWELAKQKQANNNISDERLAEIGTNLISKIGFDYDIDLSSLIEKVPKYTRKNIENSSGLNFASFAHQLKISNGKRLSFEFFAPTEPDCCCGFHYSKLPVSRIDEKSFSLIVNGKLFDIERTKELSVSEEYVLFKDENLKKPVRKWQVPFETSPYGISLDGTKLYIDLEFSNLLLEISEIGELKIVTTNNDGIISDGEDLIKRETPKVGEIIYKSGENGLMNFKSKDKNYIVEFPYVCT